MRGRAALTDIDLAAVDDETEATDASKDGSEDIVYSISSYGSDIPVDTIISRLNKGVIFVPDFQRNYVWNKVQASQFIESILLGLPVPGVFFYHETKTEKYLVIDGLQRLLTLHGFISGRFPPSKEGFTAEPVGGKSAPKADVFRLESVQQRFATKAFEDLDEIDQRRIENYVIHATNIEQDVPKDDVSSIYFVFKRINTGGTPLQPQEIRSALFHGAFNTLLERLNGLESWRSIFGPRHKRRKDEELILRFFALANEAYSAPMAKFLNDFMQKNRDLGIPLQEKFAENFTNTIDFIFSAVGRRAFRLKAGTALNAAVFDAVAVSAFLSEAAKHLTREDFSARYDALLADSKFLEAVGRATAREEQVTERLRLARAAFR